jgi:hypothetical protein
MFWGSELLVGLVFMGFFIALLALTKLPMQVIAPIYMMGLIITAIMIPAISFVIVVVIALVFASFMYSLVEH